MEDNFPPLVVPASYVLSQRVDSPLTGSGFLRRYGRLSIIVGGFIILVVLGSALFFYFEPARGTAVKRGEGKVDAPPAAVNAVARPGPGVQKEKVVGNRDRKRYHLPGIILPRG
jgi:hypothetical protein